MAQWVLETIPPDVKPSILEVGSGNGSLLFSLVDEGYHQSTICGIDYSPDAIKLAQSIAARRDGNAQKIGFSICDFLNDDIPGHVDLWDLALDKGTYDAIALGEKDESGRAPSAKYPGRIARILKSGGYFLITCEPYISYTRTLY